MKQTVALISILLLFCTGISMAQTRESTVIELNEEQAH